MTKLLKRYVGIIASYALGIGIFYVLGYKFDIMMLYIILTSIIIGEVINFALSKREK